MNKNIAIIVILLSIMAHSWNFKGKSVLYLHTNDNQGTSTLGSGESTWNDIGIQLQAYNQNLFANIGIGLEITGLYSNSKFSHNRRQYSENLKGSSGSITQSYLTYSYLNSSLKVGRQHLPKQLSPFAFTEKWQPLENAFDALVLVNSNIPHTKLIYSSIFKSNPSFGNINDFSTINKNGDTLHLLTAKNQSIENLVLIGSIYYAPEYTDKDDLTILWSDIKYQYSHYSIAFQGGQIGEMSDSKKTVAFGVKIAGEYQQFSTSLSLSTVNDGTIPLINLATGVKTPLYTQMILDQTYIREDSNSMVFRVGTHLFRGELNFALDLTQDNKNKNSDYKEMELTYKKPLNKQTTIFLAYMYNKDDLDEEGTNHARIWVRYHF